MENLSIDDKFLNIQKLKNLSPEQKLNIIERGKSRWEEVLHSTVIPIIERVKKEGDKALTAYTKKFDGFELENLFVSESEWEEGIALVDDDLKNAFQEAYENIKVFHENTKPKDVSFTTAIGTLGNVHKAVSSCAVYVPGGKAIYPSTVLMGVVPAKIAGVKNIIIATPPNREGKISPVVLYAARLAGANKILKVGGAQAMAALALGTESVPKVELIVGPGNIYVTAAKTHLSQSGSITIDSPAGPSEVIVIADETAKASWAAADILAQAEHDEDASCVFLTTSKKLASEVRLAIIEDIKTRTDRASIKGVSLQNNGSILLVDSIDEAIEFSNEYGPEHLEIMTENAKDKLKQITSGGSVFLGHYAPVAIGDYYSGTNHILPTSQAALRFSGLTTATFLKALSYQEITKDGLKKSMRAIELMSKAEGLYEEHGRSVAVRFENE